MPPPAVGLAVLASEAGAALVAAAKSTLAFIGGTLGLAGVAVLAEKIDEQTKSESKDRPEDAICEKCNGRETKKKRKERQAEEKRERDEGRPASKGKAAQIKKQADKQAGGGKKGKIVVREGHDRKDTWEPDRSEKQLKEGYKIKEKETRPHYTRKR